MFGTQFVFYKLLNILVHFGNFLLVKKFLSNLKIRFAFFISLIFLIHPLHVESISWIFQLNSMLAFTFFILCLISIEKKALLSLLFFTLSVFTKSYAAFTPFFIIIFLFSQNKSIKLSIRKSLPYFIVGLLAGLGTIRGVNQSRVESTISKNFHTDGAVNTTYKATPVAEEKEETISQTEGPPPQKAEAPEAISEPNYQDELPQVPIQNDYLIIKEESIDVAKVIFNKLSLGAQSITFYVTQFLYPQGQYFFYGTQKPSLGRKIAELFVLFAIITLALLSIIQKGTVHSKLISPWSILFLCLWIPVSGIFYVPFMKYSLYADHWAYFMTFPLAIFLGRGIEWSYSILIRYQPRLKPALFFAIPIAFFVVKTSFYSRIFNDHEYMLERNIVHNPSSIFLRRYLADYLFRRGERQRAIEILERARDIDSNDIALASQLAKYRKK